jgi:hypothetical protein
MNQWIFLIDGYGMKRESSQYKGAGDAWGQESAV